MKLLPIVKEYLPPSKTDIVFDIEVEDDHSYCVSNNRIVVHNCSSRIIAGTGYPQLSVLMECYDAVKSCGGHMISDGGCTNAGDFAKALGLSSFVMSGGYFAGYNETGNQFYGMSSTTAMNKHHNGVAKHRSSEGHEFVFDKLKGPLQSRVDELLGGLRSACTYQNVNNLDTFRDVFNFVRVNHHHNTMFFK